MAVLKITCPSCGTGIKIPDPEPDRMVVRCPKCGKGFPLATAGDESGKEQSASEEHERAAAKKRPRTGMVWGFACSRLFLPLAAFV
jgi:predicted Zn finger-like uncharacterized protein